MSYVRFSDQSDVYVYGAADGRIVCCGCVRNDGSAVSTETEAIMLVHIYVHKERGDKVPDSAITNLREGIASSFDPRSREFPTEQT